MRVQLRILFGIALTCTLITWVFLSALPGLAAVAIGLTALTVLLMVPALLVPESWFERSNRQFSGYLRRHPIITMLFCAATIGFTAFHLWNLLRRTLQ